MQHAFIIFVIASLFAIPSVSAQQPAFPSAYGAGAYTTGGRGGEVIHVTTLANSGPGSLREALKTATPRYIIFDVSGVIHLTDHIYMHPEETGDRGDFTVNGFSAPEGGITIVGKAIRTSGGISNMIWRGIRFRNGYLAPEPSRSSNWTCLGMRGASDVVVDRCSFSFARSKGLGGGTAGVGESATRQSFQNNLFGNSQQGMLVGNSDGEEFGTVSVLGNVFSNLGWRHPKAGGALSLDVINNLSHNWQGRTIRMDAWDYKLNMIGNYYQGGPITRVAQRDDKKMFTTWTNTTMNPQIWDEDNFIEEQHRAANYPDQPEAGWYPFATATDPVKSEWFVDSRLEIQGRARPILLSQDLKDELLPKVGACEYIDDNGDVQFYRDSIDEKLVNDAQTNADSVFVPTDEYESLSYDLVNTMPTATRPATYYDNNPHIPEFWFSANVPNGQDHNDIAPSGYTWLEEYLNRIDGPQTDPTELDGPLEPSPDVGVIQDVGQGVDVGVSDVGTSDIGATDTAISGSEVNGDGGCGCSSSNPTSTLASAFMCVFLLIISAGRRKRKRIR